MSQSIMRCDPFVSGCKRVIIKQESNQYGARYAITFEPADSSQRQYTLNVWGLGYHADSPFPELILDESVVPITGASADSLHRASERYEPADKLIKDSNDGAAFALPVVGGK